MKCDYLIIGGGIIGLTIAKELKERFSDANIAIIEKESKVGLHSSGRNSGVLHAGFYYSANSLKAKFTKDGNALMKEFVKKHNLALNEFQKVVVAQNENEVETIYELKRRGDLNGVDTKLIDEDELAKIDSNAKTCKVALYSPTTATVNPKEVTKKVAEVIQNLGVKIYFNEPFIDYKDGIIFTRTKKIKAKTIINASGLYADRVAKYFGCGKDYVIIPFKGIYLKYTKDDKPIKTNIYPVPNLKNPFLGVHYTITVDGTIKIGPTAIPAFWRENYRGFKNFNLKDLTEILYYEAKLFLLNSFGFRDLAFEEIKKYSKSYLQNLSTSLVKKIDKSGFSKWSIPGIRAQLLNINTNELVQDFVVEKSGNSIHILNAVSPAFTCSFAFAKWVVDEYID